MRIALCLATGLAALASPSVLAQDALGSGRALDANLNTTSGGFNAAARQEDFAARNRIITNNVVGGRGFRGSVGYTAAEDFRGFTGSDDLFRFRADSAWSDVNFVNFGSTYQRVRFGQDMGILGYDRTSAGVTTDSLARRVYRRNQIADAKLRLDRLAALSSLADDAARRVEPLGIGYVRDEEGQTYSIGVSSLRGLETTPVQQEARLLGLTTFDVARLREDIVAGRDVRELGQPFENRLEDLVLSDARVEPATEAGTEPEGVPGTEPGLIDPAAEPQPLIVTRKTGHDLILERIAERYAEEEGESDLTPEEQMLAELEANLERLRTWLRGGEEEEGPETGEEPVDAGAPETGDEESDLPEIYTRPPLEPPDIGVILRHGLRVDELASKDQTRFNELVASGEEALRQGEYFRAERRFNRALRFTPGHPMATAGLAHAQLGAGLYVAAALTVRGLFTHQPEMIDTRYHAALVPDATRLDRAVNTLRTRIAEADHASDALLLAYVGRLLDERPIIEEGVSALAAAAPDDPLLPLLQTIWLGQEETGAPPPEK